MSENGKWESEDLELIYFLVLLGVFIICSFAFKFPVSISMVVACIVTTLIAGYGIPVRHLIEGTFGFIDTILIIATATTFMKVVAESGALEGINAFIIKKFYKQTAILLILLMFIIMLPGMITGSSTACVLTTGVMVAPILLVMGIPVETTGAIIALGAILGMAAPPINLPVMIMGGGIDMPYSGFTVPLLVLTFPLAIFSVLFLGLKHVKPIDIEKVTVEMNLNKKINPVAYLPIVIVIALMVLTSTLPQIFPNLGMSLIFMIGAISGVLLNRNINLLKISKEAIRTTLPVLGILMAVGMLIQVMTLSGIRGFIVINSINLPKTLIYGAVATTMPVFGAISCFASASVLGVPYMFALLEDNQIITAAGLSLFASMGDLIPPAALAGIFAAQILKMESYFPILKKCIAPGIVFIAWGLTFVIFSKQLAFLAIR